MKAPANTTKIKHRGHIIRKKGDRYQAEFYKPGAKQKRTRKSFNEISDAEQWLDAMLDAVSTSGTDILQLTTNQSKQAAQAIQKAAERVSLTDAVDFWLLHHPATEIPTVHDFWGDYYRKLEIEKGAEKSYLGPLRSNVGKLLVSQLGDIKLNEVTTEQLRTVLDGHTHVNARTKKNIRTQWTTFFNVAKERKYLVANPADGLKGDFTTRNPTRKQKNASRTKIGILTPDQAKKLLDGYEKYRPDMLVPFVLSLFCGIRAATISRMDWSMIDLEGHEVNLPGEIVKTGNGRTVPISENALEWLLLHPDRRTGRLIEAPDGDTDKALKRFEAARLRVLRATKVAWPKNGGRHSFGSYYCRLTEDEFKTFTAMGHDDIDMLRKHYKNAKISKADCKAFWSIRPGDGESILFGEVSA